MDPPSGNAIMPPGKGATHWQDHIWFPTSPLKALQAKLPNTKIEFDPGRTCNRRRSWPRALIVAIVFAYQWIAEDMDVPSLSLPDNQDALIEQVAAANPRTIVVLETGRPSPCRGSTKSLGWSRRGTRAVRDTRHWQMYSSGT